VSIVSIVPIVSTLFAANWQQGAGLKGDSGAIQAPLSDHFFATEILFGRQAHFNEPF
jgi:hypothetical protein